MRSYSRTDVLTVSALSLLWALLLVSSGAVVAGYHLVDDHEIVRIVAELRDGTPWTVASRWIARDLTFRFRPLYFAHRVAESAVFGEAFVAWGMYTAALGIACSALLYAALRAVAFTPVESVVFAFFALAGEQAAVWWRLGPNETIGMVFLAATALAIGRHARTGSLAARMSFVAAAAAASLCKESFILAIPALLLAYVWAWRATHDASWVDALRRALPEATVLLVGLVAELVFIKLRVGTDIGYAGVGAMHVSRVLQTAWHITRFGGLWWIIVALAVVAAAGGLRPLLATAPPAVVLFALVVGPQAILYEKSGVVERYYLPGVLAPAFAVALCLRYLRTAKASPPERGPTSRVGGPASSRIPARLSRLATLRIVGLLSLAPLVALGIQQGRTTYRNAQSFTREGDQAFVARIASSAPRGPILVAGGLAGIYEGFWSLRWYLECKAGRRDVYFEFIDHEPRSEFANGVLARFETDDFYPKRARTGDVAPFATVAILGGAEAAFLSSAAGWFEPAEYERDEMGWKRLAVYTRKRD